eukprot:4811144-Karenia_brevis.AAC.1
MDKQKTKEELKPSRMLNRAWLSYKDVGNEPTIKKNQVLKTLEREDGTVLEWVHGDTFTLTETARNVLGPALSDV